MEHSLAAEIASRVSERGGRAYYVGGFVRDAVLGIENKDIDIEVHGIEPADLFSLLSELGEPLSYGSSFGIYSVKGSGIDVALPRTERATGRGHRDFEVFCDPYLGPEKAARRRDFTMNALMKDVLSGEILDFFGGMEDIRRGIIRHVDDDSFAEDPLRVLRAAQFAARFGFKMAPETVSLCSRMDLTALSRERVEGEMRKALEKAEKPSVFFEFLRETGQLGFWFPELKALIGVEQDPRFHPEGDVWVHSMEVLDRAASFRAEAKKPYFFMLAALTHDLGKADTTERPEKDGRLHAYGHEAEGVPIAERFLSRLTSDRELTAYVLNMIPLHMKPNLAAYAKPPLKKTNHMFDESVCPEDLIALALADRPVFSGSVPFSGDREFLEERLAEYRKIMNRPHVEGRDLIAAGLAPGEYFGELLGFAHKLRLAGIDKESALKQTLAMARKMNV
jgi:tRNA nucleotidyltransferase (CCA-adding enzyme)